MNYLKLIFINSIIALMLINNTYGQDFEVVPVNLNYNTEPGQSQTRVITVRNHSSKKESFSITLEDFVINKEGSKLYNDPNATNHALSSWLSISPSFFELNPNEEKNVEINIQVPQNNHSTRWCMLYVNTVKEQDAMGADKAVNAGVKVVGRIGVKVLQSPESNQNFKARIFNLTEITKPGSGERTFTAKIENTGDKIVKCKVYLIAANVVTAQETKYDAVLIESFPGSIVTVELKLPGGLPAGKYALSAILDYGSKTNLEGTQIVIDVP